METTEKVVEAYFRYIMGCATIPNIKCAGQYEIDLLAINPKTNEKYHVETGVSISGSFTKLTSKPYDKEKSKVRLHQASQRRTLGYFTEKKFAAPGIISKLAEYGFAHGNYEKVIVTWGWDIGVDELAKNQGIVLLHFATILKDIAKKFRESNQYFTDDTLRTLQLFAKANTD